LEPRIVGGFTASQGDDPWQVALIDARIRENDVWCGGSLVDRQWVLTAAHCVDNGTPPSEVDIVAGATDLDRPGQRVSVAEILVHAGYIGETEGNITNDIALMRLAAYVSLNDRGSPRVIGMADAAVNGRLGGGVDVRVTGWGYTDPQAPAMERKLRYVGLNVVTNEDCNDPFAYNGVVQAHMMCAGYLGSVERGRDSCNGDSGGPLTLAHGGGRVLVGIVSYGPRDCGATPVPGVYTRVASFRTWANGCMRDTDACEQRRWD
jgi:secreted trypsin-like serine protease